MQPVTGTSCQRILPDRIGQGASPSRLAAGVLALALGACAAIPPDYITSSEPLVSRSLAVRVGSTPSFYADTPERRLFGPFGAVSALRNGNQLIAEHEIADPAHRMSRQLATRLVDTNRMTLTDLDSADVVMDVKTTNWDFRPHRNDPAQLYVVYAARVTLTERASGRVLSMSRCRSVRDPQSDRASLDELLANDADLLRAELDDAVHQCMDRLLDGPLRWAMTPPVQSIARHAAAPGRH